MRDHPKPGSNQFIITTLFEDTYKRNTNKVVLQDSTEPTRSDIITSDHKFLFENVR